MTPSKRNAGDDEKYGALLAATRPGVITDDDELNRLTEEVNRLVTRGIKESHLSPEEEKLLNLLTRLIEDYELRHEPLQDVHIHKSKFAPDEPNCLLSGPLGLLPGRKDFSSLQLMKGSAVPSVWFCHKGTSAEQVHDIEPIEPLLS